MVTAGAARFELTNVYYLMTFLTFSPSHLVTVVTVLTCIVRLSSSSIALLLVSVVLL